MINIIYGLRDPRNDVYQYIGKSTVGVSRPLQHLIHSHSDKVNEWVAKLGENWLYPIIDIIEEVEELDDLSEREKYWINHYYEINPNLLNIQNVITPLQNKMTEEDEAAFYYISSIISDLPSLLKKGRMCRGLTQGELSKEMGVSRSTVSLCERGGNVQLKVIQQYLRTLKGIDILSKTFGKRVNGGRCRKQSKSKV